MKVKYQKSNTNNCVHRALSSMTKLPKKQIAKDLPMSKQGVKYENWKHYAEKLGVTVKEMKTPIPTTMEAISEMSKSHKSGIIARLVSDSGNHTLYIKNGKPTDNVKSVNKNSIVTLHSIAFKD